MFIEFTKVTGKNFLSIGNTPLSLNLNDHSKSLIIGKNGMGKSIWLDLIIFALYGKAYRNINKSALINSINGKQCETEIEFTINEIQYKVIRNIKPEKFEIYIDGVLLEQDAASKDYQAYLETNILKLDYKSTTQMVIIGAMNYIPFLQLKSADRRVFVENLLDLQLFTDMNKNLKLIIADEKSKYTSTQNGINLYKSKIETYTNIIRDLESNKDKKKDQIEGQIKEKMVEYKSLIQLVEDVKLKVADCIYDDNSPQLQNAINDSNTKLSIAQTTNTKLATKIKYFDTTSECQTCEQSIEPSHKQSHIDAMNIDIEKNKDIIAQANASKIESQLALDILKNKKQTKQTLEGQLKTNTDNAEWIKKDVIRLNNDKKLLDTSDDSTLSNSKIELSNNKELNSQSEVILNESYEILKVYAIMLNDLKDTGAKANIIQNYIPIINATVNRYLDKFNLYVKFELDDQFNETLHSRHRDDFTYESFSNGERFRINMAMLFSWLELTKVRAGVSTNVLFLDEILEICDESGFDELLSIIDTMPKTNLFVISHKENLDVKFDKVITMIKEKEFSQFID